MSIVDLQLEAACLHKANGPTGALVGVQPFDSFSMSGTDSMADGPGCLLLHMSLNFAYQGFGRQR
jgi:hypothetical protein